MSKKALEQKLEALPSLASADDFRKALADRNNYYVSKAAALIGARELRELVPELIAAFDRFMKDAVKSDPQCWAKNAIAKTLKDFGLDDAAFFVGGMKYVQLEPVWSPERFADTAGTLRGICAFALTQCSIPRAVAMTHLVDLLGADKEKIVRMDAARAIAHLGGAESVLLLRLKSLTGDPEPEVIGQCFAGLLYLAPHDHILFVAEFLGRDDDVRFEAASVLGEHPDPAAIAVLTAHFDQTRDTEMRRAILLSLGASRIESARDFLMATLERGGLEDAIACVRALSVSRFHDEVRDKVHAIAHSRGEPKLLAALQETR